MLFHQAGIGTYSSNGVLNKPVLETISKSLDLMFASSIGNHIKGPSSPSIILTVPNQSLQRGICF